MSPFKFNLGQQVKIAVSDEAGQVIGRAEYTTDTNSYFLRYKNADGNAVQAWWDEDALTGEQFDPSCEYCHGTGISRIAYSSKSGPCAVCCTTDRASSPSSIASATTEASVGGSVK